MNATLETIIQASTHGERYVTSDFGRLTGQGPKVKADLAVARKAGFLVRVGNYWRVSHMQSTLADDKGLRDRSILALTIELGTLIEMAQGGLTGWSPHELLLQMASIETFLGTVGGDLEPLTPPGT